MTGLKKLNKISLNLFVLTAFLPASTHPEHLSDQPESRLCLTAKQTSAHASDVVLCLYIKTYIKVWCGIIFSDFISVKFIFTAVSNPRSPSTLLHKPVQRRTYVSCLCKAHLKSSCGLILSGAQTPGRVWVSHLRALQKPTHKLQRGSWYSYTCDNMT